MKKRDLEDYVKRLEACVRKASGLRDQAMLRMNDSPVAVRVVEEYDAERAKITEI